MKGEGGLENSLQVGRRDDLPGFKGSAEWLEWREKLADEFRFEDIQGVQGSLGWFVSPDPSRSQPVSFPGKPCHTAPLSASGKHKDVVCSSPRENKVLIYAIFYENYSFFQ